MSRAMATSLHMLNHTTRLGLLQCAGCDVCAKLSSRSLKVVTKVYCGTDPMGRFTLSLAA